MGEVFYEITIIICLAAALSIVFRVFKQPAILAYILTGILVGPLAIIPIHSEHTLESLAQIGITLLLFLLGLELRLGELKSVGKVALATGIGQILFTSFFGYFICLALGFSPLASLYIAVALTFSSTIIVVKLLSDKRDLQSLYGKISVGFLLVQDFFAIIALILLSGFNTTNSGGISPIEIGILLAKAIALFGFVIFLSKTILPIVINKIARSSEILFLFSLAWAFGISALVTSPLIGFSIEIGGFLAGLALANSTQNFHIVSKIRSLRDFFITIFFVTLGMQLAVDNVMAIWFPAVLLSLFVLIGNPIIVMIILGLMGYKKRTSFLAGLTVAQISEFSLIVVFMGNKIGHLSEEAVSLVTIVGAITFVISTYMITNGNTLYKFLSPILSVFERKNSKEKRVDFGELKNHVVLVGANRMGKSILHTLLEEGEKVVVIDFNPDIIKDLSDKGIPSLFGDAADVDIQEKAQFENAKLIISTVGDGEDNLLLIEGAKHFNKKAKIVVEAYDIDEAKDLYKAGADYVILPHLSSGRHIAKLLKGENLEEIEKFRKQDESYFV